MSQRYVLVVGPGGTARERLLARVARSAGLKIAYASEQLAALASPDCRCVSLADTGCVLGSFFHRHGLAEQVQRLTIAEQSRISNSQGRALLDRFWGGYVAALVTSDGAIVVRDPSGMLSAYYATDAGFLLVASDAELLINAGVAATVDVEEIGRQFYRASVPAPSTALRGIRELLAGFALCISSMGVELKPCWSPWDHAASSAKSLQQLADELHEIVERCTRAWASTHRHFLLSVSGGLDSSILAACLARSSSTTTCLTMFADDPTGDERPFARMLCDQLGLPLIEWPYRLEDIDIREPLAPHLPRPRDRTQANAYERVHLEVARETGADAFMTGNGGDNVFGYSQSAAPVADRYLHEGLGRGILTSLLDICRQTGCNIPDAVKQAWRMAQSSPNFRIAPKPLLLDSAFAAALSPSDLWHPWLDAPHGALPGKAAHIASILRAQPSLEAGRAHHLPLVSTLMSQPIVEACLAIPSWEWRAGGRDRSVARRAFAADLPQAILSRTVKGSPSGFGARLLDHFRASIRERVLDGRLAAGGIVDRSAIENILTGEKPVPHAERVRVLEMVNAEAWIDHWANRKTAEPAEPNVRSDDHDCLQPSGGPIP